MGKFVSFVLGGTIGALAALLLAPRTGVETRNMVADYAGSMGTNAQEIGDKAKETIEAGIKQAKDKGSELLGNVQNATDDAKTVASDKNDELRKKIEAARERIAAQVKENAAGDAEAVKDATPKVADKAKEAVDKAKDAVNNAADKAKEAVDKAADKVSK